MGESCMHLRKSRVSSQDLSGNGYKLINGVWVSDALLFYLERKESARIQDGPSEKDAASHC